MRGNSHSYYLEIYRLIGEVSYYEGGGQSPALIHPYFSLWILNSILPAHEW